MLIAKDIMTKEVICVKKTTKVCDAIEQMLNNQVAGLPVVDDEMNLQGIITEKDVLKFYGASEEALSKTVEDFMTTPVIHFEEDESLQQICLSLIEHDFRRVPVTVDGKVVGVISRPDVARLILDFSHQSISK